MRIERLRQTSTKISYSSEAEFVNKFNALRVVGDMPVSIKPTIPDATDTKQWCSVNYYEHLV